MSFDSGLPRSQRETLQTAIIARLAQLVRPLGFVQAIKACPWHILDEDSWDRAHQLVLGQYPSLLVGVLDLEMKQSGGPGRGTGVLEVQITHVSNHKRSVVEGRVTTDAKGMTSPGADQGLWALTELVHYLLYDFNFRIPTIHQLRLEKEVEIVADGDFSAWQQTYMIPVERNVDWHRGITAKLEQLLTTLQESTTTAAGDIVAKSDNPAP